MDMEFGMPGMLAVSKAGRDRGSLYVIIEEAGEYVYLADGRNRTISRPKRKNRKHIQIKIGRASCRERVSIRV